MRMVKTVLASNAFRGSFTNNTVEDALYDVAFTINAECAVSNPRKRAQVREPTLCYGAVARWLRRDFAAGGNYQNSVKSIYFYQLEQLNGDNEWEWRDPMFDYADHVILVDGDTSNVLVDVYQPGLLDVTESRYETTDGRVFNLVRRVPVLDFVHSYFAAPN
jgi:hypothetical protein